MSPFACCAGTTSAPSPRRARSRWPARTAPADARHLDQLVAAGQEIKEEEVAWSVLAGLPDNFESMVKIIRVNDKCVYNNLIK